MLDAPPVEALWWLIMNTATAGRASGRVRRVCAVAGAIVLLLGATAGSGCARESAASEPRPFSVHGTEVGGTADRDNAPTLRPGRYTDVAPPATRSRHYVIRREMDRSTMYVGFTARPKRPTPDDLIQLDLWTMSGTQCGRGESRDYDIRRHNSLVTAAVDSANISRDSSDLDRRACATATELHLVVTPTYGESSLAGADTELVVLEEPDAREDDELPEPVRASADWGPPMPLEQRESVVPGPSFAQAPRLGPGNYRSTLRPGEVRLYRVELNWGQRLRTQTRIPEPADDLLDRIDPDQQVDVRLISPTRAEVGVDETVLPRAAASRIERDGTTRLAQMTYDVRYRNRNASGRPYVAGASLPGDYYVAITMSGDAEDETYELPYTLDIAVDDTSDGQDPGYAGDGSVSGPLVEQPMAVDGSGPTWLKTVIVTVLFALGGLALAFGGGAMFVARRALRLG